MCCRFREDIYQVSVAAHDFGKRPSKGGFPGLTEKELEQYKKNVFHFREFNHLLLKQLFKSQKRSFIILIKRGKFF